MPKVSILLGTGALYSRLSAATLLTQIQTSTDAYHSRKLWSEPSESLMIFVLNDISVPHTCPAILGAECAHGMTTPVLTIAEFQLGCSLEFLLHFSIAQLALKLSL